ncbi:hypothetical protein R3W88_032167 [Solanum pinnatisectum]|uniref:Uncharacterized protein n=1 Tax=Solanum pinnatisectum TaxID=50273 RepID=A0AAV9LS03_9SOLN|nr:hypothetical protein R3W88_032167 [Solanum pinnatisectum]
MPHPPTGFVSAGCIACKGAPNQSDFGSLRCTRSDMVPGDQFLEQSIWDTSDTKFTKKAFSLWVIGDELTDRDMASDLGDMVVDTEIRTFSAVLFDEYGGLQIGTKYSPVLDKQAPNTD